VSGGIMDGFDDQLAIQNTTDTIPYYIEASTTPNYYNLYNKYDMPLLYSDDYTYNWTIEWALVAPWIFAGFSL
jgi:hypothetical protein